MNKTEYFTLKEDGVIGWIPIMPDSADFVDTDDNVTGTYDSDGYNEALQSAIANVTEVSNPETVIQAIQGDTYWMGRDLELGKIYPLQCHVHVYDTNAVGKRLALVTFPSSSGVEETQEELPEVIKFLLGEAPLDGHWFGDSYARGGKFWWRPELRKLFEHKTRKNK